MNIHTVDPRHRVIENQARLELIERVALVAGLAREPLLAPDLRGDDLALDDAARRIGLQRPCREQPGRLRNEHQNQERS